MRIFGAKCAQAIEQHVESESRSRYAEAYVARNALITSKSRAPLSKIFRSDFTNESITTARAINYSGIDLEVRTPKNRTHHSRPKLARKSIKSICINDIQNSINPRLKKRTLQCAKRVSLPNIRNTFEHIMRTTAAASSSINIKIARLQPPEVIRS